MMLNLISILLLTLPPLKSETCNEATEYSENDQCCKKCAAGQFMTMRCTSESDTQCKNCSKGYFTDHVNINYQKCTLCTSCTKKHMKFEKNCTQTRNAVCTCEKGFTCSDDNCNSCSPALVEPTLQTTSASVLKPPTTDNMWVLVSLCFACVCVCVVFTCFLFNSRQAEPNKWISSNLGFWTCKSSKSRSSQCAGEEDISLPVQEVCAKTDILENV